MQEHHWHIHKLKQTKLQPGLVVFYVIWPGMWPAATGTDMCWLIDWLSTVQCLQQHSIGYTGDGFTSQRPNQQYQSTEGTHKLHN